MTTFSDSELDRQVADADERTRRLFDEQLDKRLEHFDKLSRDDSTRGVFRILDAIDDERRRRAARRAIDAEERGAVTLPEFVSLRARLAQPREPLRYRVADLFLEGNRVMLAAQFKAGKTTLRDNLARGLVDGDAFLGRYAVTPVSGTVVMVDTEMGPHQMDQWLAAQRIKNDDRLIPLSMRGKGASFDILNLDVRRMWAERLKGYGASFLVLDCLRPVLDALGLDEHRDAGRFLVAFDALLAEAGVPEALIIHHMGHMGERARGDSRLRDWPDCEWRLVRQDDDPASPRFFAAYGRDVDVAEQGLTYDASTRRLTAAGGSRRDARAVEVLDGIRGVLQEAADPLSGLAIKRVLANTDTGAKAVDAALKYGVRMGALQKRPGPNRSNLYSVSQYSPVFPECSRSTSVSCSPPYKGGNTGTHDQPRIHEDADGIRL